jgi:hypothetical protein
MLNKLNPFRTPSPVVLARVELEDAQRSLLLSQSAAEYASRLSEYHQDRIKRLTAMIKDAHTEGENQ